MAITVLIADDQAMVRQGFGALLAAQADISVVGDAENGRVAVAEAKRLRPDVVLMDVRMPELNGLDAARDILAAHLDPPVRVLMLTTFDLDDYVYEALRIGASGFLLKDAPADELVRAVRVVAAGQAPARAERHQTPDRRRHQTPRRRTPATRGAVDPHPARTRGPRTRRAGPVQRRDRAALFVAEQTVKTHVGKVLAKLSLRDRAQAVVLAYESGVVAPG